MEARRANRFATAAVAVALLAGCGEEPEPAPRPMDASGSGAAAGSGSEPAPPSPGVPSDPRLVLFDVQTALQTVRPTQGEYPSVEAFRAGDVWRIQRERLDAVFDEWSYQSDGGSYRLRGVVGDRAYEVSGP